MNMIDRLKQQNLMKVFPEEEAILDQRSQMLNEIQKRKQSINPINDMLLGIGTGLLASPDDEMPLQALGKSVKEGKVAYDRARQMQDAYSEQELAIHNAVSNSIKAVREFEAREAYQKRSLDLEERKMALDYDFKTKQLNNEQRKEFFNQEAKTASELVKNGMELENILPLVNRAKKLLDDENTSWGGVKGKFSKVFGSDNPGYNELKSISEMLNDHYARISKNKKTDLFSPDNSRSEFKAALKTFERDANPIIEKARLMQEGVMNGFTPTQVNQLIHKIEVHNSQSPKQKIDYNSVFKKTTNTDEQEIKKKDKLELDNLVLAETESLPLPEQKDENQVIENLNQTKWNDPSRNPAIGYREDVMPYFNPETEKVEKRDPMVVRAVANAYGTPGTIGDIYNVLKSVWTGKDIKESHYRNMADSVYRASGNEDLIPKDSKAEMLENILGMPLSTGVFGAMGKGISTAGTALKNVPYAKTAGKVFDKTGKFLSMGSDPTNLTDVGANMASYLAGNVSDNPYINIASSIYGGNVARKAGDFANSALLTKHTNVNPNKFSSHDIYDTMENFGIPILPADVGGKFSKLIEGGAQSSFFNKGDKVQNIRQKQKDLIAQRLIGGDNQIGFFEDVTRAGQQKGGAFTKEKTRDYANHLKSEIHREWTNMKEKINSHVKEVPMKNLYETLENKLKSLDYNPSAIQKFVKSPAGMFIVDILGKDAVYSNKEFTSVVVDGRVIKLRTDVLHQLTNEEGRKELINQIKKINYNQLDTTLNEYSSKYSNELTKRSRNQRFYELSDILDSARRDLKNTVEDALQKNYGKETVKEYREISKDYAEFKRFQESDLNDLIRNADRSDSEFFKSFYEKAKKGGKFVQDVVKNISEEEMPYFRKLMSEQLGYDKTAAGGTNNFNQNKFASRYSDLSDEAKTLIYGKEKLVIDDLVQIIHKLQEATGGYNLSNTANVGAVIKQIAAVGALAKGGYDYLTNERDFVKSIQTPVLALSTYWLASKYATSPTIAKQLVNLSKASNKNSFIKAYNEITNSVNNIGDKRLLKSIMSTIQQTIPKTFKPFYDPKDEHEYNEKNGE